MEDVFGRPITQTTPPEKVNRHPLAPNPGVDQVPPQSPGYRGFNAQMDEPAEETAWAQGQAESADAGHRVRSSMAQSRNIVNAIGPEATGQDPSGGKYIVRPAVPGYDYRVPEPGPEVLGPVPPYYRDL